MPTGRAQQRGTGIPGGPDLQQQIQALRNALGLNGPSPQSYFCIRDGNNVQRVRLGFLPTDEWGIYFFDTTGRLLVKADYSGLTVLDSTNKTRAVLGALSSGDFGLEVIDPTGNVQEILPVNAATSAVVGTLSASTSWVKWGITGSTVVADIAASGKALISMYAWLVSVPSTTAYVGIGLDGAAPTYAVGSGWPMCAMGPNVSGSCSAAGVVSASAGSAHTFDLWVACSAANNCAFESCTLVVQPL